MPRHLWPLETYSIRLSILMEFYDLALIKSSTYLNDISITVKVLIFLITWIHRASKKSETWRNTEKKFQLNTHDHLVSNTPFKPT